MAAATPPAPSDKSQTILAKHKTQRKAIQERCLIFVPKVDKKKEGKRKALAITYEVEGVESAEFTPENELLVVGTEEIDWTYLIDELREKFGPGVRQRTLEAHVDASIR